VVVQSTQNIDDVTKIVDRLRKIIPDLKFYNTICGTTRVRQNEIRSMPKENDVMLVIGSKSSANTKRLYQLSKAYNKNTHWIQSAAQLNPAWFKKVCSVGITSGASTPDYTTKEVIKRIEEIEATPR
jgi:4-hydroxy-3-methylbut-2-enyl diphosphate reductase